jgi:hypothetical protein
MHRITTLMCLCGAQLDEVDTDTGIAIACNECGAAETWPEHITHQEETEPMPPTPTDCPITHDDVHTAANVLAHLNKMLGYEDIEWWSPDHLREITTRVPDPKGRAQIATAIRVVKAMNARWGYSDSDGYAPISVRRYAADLPEVSNG